ncbi:FAD-binding domain-containing protein [Aspergillus cavernicola]|uniref:FAD-binding domain-containing protein n=1 Tax=Aspergillus cavernicola TaxID=176166 RepID=A0ABR4IJY4_9EURO
MDCLFLFTILGLVEARSSRVTVSLASVNQSAWDALDRSVGGRLYDGEPMLAPCYIRYNGQVQRPDIGECVVLQQNRTKLGFASNEFGGYQNANWGACQAAGESCAFTSTSPDLITPITRMCYQGSVPSKYVDARSVRDIQETLSFAQMNNVRLVIKNTGHDYSGRSSGADSLALWTHHLQPPIKLKRKFIPDGCPEAVGDVITFGAGQQFAGIYKFAHEHNYRVVGGSSSTVGAAGGWITGGGHSLLSNELGLGVDNVQQLRAVLPNGTYVTANRCQNQDLFFALRGGGGSTFGVITEMSTFAHPEKPMVVATVTFMGISPTSASQLISISVANADRWASEGWGGYIVLGLDANGLSTFSMATSMLNQTAAETSMKPVMDLVNRLDTPVVANISASETYFEVLHSLIASEETSPTGFAMAMSSRIIPREYFQGTVNQDKLSSILDGILVAPQEDSDNGKSTLPTSSLFICAVAPTIYSQNFPESDKSDGPGASSITNAWRTGLWHAIHLHPFADTTTSDPDAVREIFQVVHDTMNPLREFTPNGGAYQNEADTFETDPIGSFWGNENYARLLKIKREVDPANLLSVHNGVGWDREDERFTCYPDVDLGV